MQVRELDDVPRYFLPKVDVRMTHGLALTTVPTALMDTTFQLGYLGNGYQF